MKVGQYCKRSVVTIDVAADVAEAAKQMRLHHVGFLVVLDGQAIRRKPVGVITDRDIVVQIDARDTDPRALRVDEVMTRKPVVASENDDLSDLVQAMRLAGIRRVPVVDVAGSLCGVIATDDVIGVLTDLLCEIRGSFHQEQRVEHRVHG